jgi:hypothetical protein
MEVVKHLTDQARDLVPVPRAPPTRQRNAVASMLDWQEVQIWIWALTREGAVGSSHHRVAWLSNDQVLELKCRRIWSWWRGLVWRRLMKDEREISECVQQGSVVILTCRRTSSPLPGYIRKQNRSEALSAEYGRSNCQLKSKRGVVNVFGLGYDKATAQPPSFAARLARTYH